MSASCPGTIAWLSIVLFAWVARPQTLQPGISESSATSRVDLAEFATPLPAPDCGLQWHGPMRVREVHLTSVGDQPVGVWRIEWWGSVWPDHGTGGWIRLDDPWNGKWVRIAATPSPDKEGAWIFRMPPLTREEWSGALEPKRYPDSKAPDYRKTLKLRVVDSTGRPVAEWVTLKVFGDAHWAEGAFDLHYRFNRDGHVTFRLEITHGTLLTLAPLSGPVETHGTTWTAHGRAGSSAGVRANIRYVDVPDLNGEELSRVTVRTGSDPQTTGFSFVPQDVPAQEAMRLSDFGFLIAPANLNRTWDNDPGPGADAWPKRVRHRLVERPEATRQSALAGLPRLAPARDVPLGVPAARQEFFVSPTGDWAILGLSLNTDNGRDAQRWVFRPFFGNERLDEELRATLDTRAEPVFDDRDRAELRRYLEEDQLPLIHVTWRTGPIAFHHELAATILEGDYGDDIRRRGDETVVLLTRLSITNASTDPQTATVNLRFNLDWPLHLEPNGLISVDWPTNRARPVGLAPVRGQVLESPLASGQPDSWELLPADKAGHSVRLRWRATLRPQEARALYFKAPFVELLEPKEVERLKSIRFETAVADLLNYWRQRLAGRMQLSVPDPMLNHFYEANLWHTLITTDRDPETGLYNQGVGTVRYRVFANETVMIARYMDLVGEPQEAERFLEPMLHFQGQEPLTGRFSTREGVFHSAGQYTHGQYAMNHGFVLWGVADHYRFTRDRAYLERAAPRLVKGCDFLFRERQATLTPPGQPRSPTHGLSPASSLEDVIEFQYWLAANSYFHLGLKRVAQALGDIHHPDAARIAREAEAYRRDIESAAREATTQAAAVRLRDHSWIPYVPSRIYQWRHLTEGWIREALYPALHLAAAEVVSYRDPLITWMLDDLEDNIFFSWQSGYNVADYEHTWFEHGAVTLQPCLLELAPTYLARDEIAAALRNFWNTYALSIYPDVHCFAEWAPRFGQGGGPVYKTSDEARFLIWLRQLLIWEDGEDLWYGRGVPRAWLEDGNELRLERACTPFGETSLLCRSAVHKGRIHTRIQLPSRQLPKTGWLRLRHPQHRIPVAVQIDGEPMQNSHLQGENIRLPLRDLCPGQRIELLAVYPE